MKYIANSITLARMFLILSLLAVSPHSINYLIIYSICGVGDMLDGYIARKTHTTSPLGAKLDSLADGIMVIVVGITLVPNIQLGLGIWVWIIVIALSRVMAVGIAWKRHKSMWLLHTYANKLTGFLLFLLPYDLYIENFGVSYVGVLIICLVAQLSALEEVYINMRSKKFDANIRGFWDLNREKKR